MTFLPIVERELRVAARRRATYWTRFLAAVIAFLIFGGIGAIFELSSGRMGFGSQMGPVLFGVFSWLSFAFVASAGVFLTADSLSDEKREGTLGLLFLTDLRGYDVVIGKLLSSSLSAVYGLLAAFPIIGISFLVGGVTGAEFWRLLLVLVNTLFFSLAAGILVSAFSREAQGAMTRTALVGLLFLVGLPTLDWIAASWDKTKFEPVFSLVSPSFSFSQSSETRLHDFWLSLGLTHLMAWAFLVVACVATPRMWKETGSVPEGGVQSRMQRLRFGSPRRRASFRERWLGQNPVRWLAARDLGATRSQWLILAVIAVLGGLVCLGVADAQVRVSIAQGACALATLLLVLWVASQASRFFVDAMRTGTIELLLATPLTAKQIVLGQWWSLRRRFLCPTLLLMLVELLLMAAQFDAMQQNFAKNNSTLTFEVAIHYVTNVIDSVVSLFTSLLAMAWFGMWMGMTSRKANVAVIKTIVFVQVIPFVALMFLNLALMMTANFVFSGGSWHWIIQPVMTLLEVLINLMFLMMARRKLSSRFREMATRSGDVVGSAKSPPLPPGLVAATTTTAGA